ncbi:MAG: tetratricopeptide repeat protein [Candidatus Acidiferrales bacterium]|jgi:tetratricopeptide (TPR) repeat protein
MTRTIPAWITLVAVVLIASIVGAQGSTRIEGQVLDIQANPWPDITVQMKNVDTSQVFTVKTDRMGHFSQLVPRGGIYEFELINEQAKLDFTERHSITEGQPNAISFNFKDLVAQQKNASAEESKKAEEQANAFKNMKSHFDAGIVAMNDSAQVRQQLASAPADQKSALQDKLKADGQTAVTEFQQAEQGASPKDTKNHALIWANLGQAYDTAGNFNDAAGAYQKAVDLQPQPNYYVSLGTALAKAGAEQNDQQKISGAGAACDKATALDPTTSDTCWKNVGIVLSNKGDLKDAIAPFQKATQANPKDAQAWFLLGSAFTGTIDTKQEGDKVVYIIPPGTAESYQKCIDADPNGPYAPQAKAALDNIAQLSGGVQTQIGTDSKKKKKQ